MISGADLFLLLPALILASASIVVMLAIAIKRNYRLVVFLTLFALLLAFLSLVQQQESTTVRIGILFVLNGMSRLFMGLILSASFIVVLMSYRYLQGKKLVKEEYFILLLLATLGALCIVISNHFIAFFIGLELLSVSLYALIAYLKEKDTAIEAGLKYLILAAVSTAFLLFGVALLYSQTGSLSLDFTSTKLTNGGVYAPTFWAGLAFIMVGILFKLGLVPFHLWTSDVYVGASPPVTAFIATVSKGSVFAFLLHLFSQWEGFSGNKVWVAFAIVALLSMFIGNWLALQEQNVKRILAYSSIAHLGYVLVAFLAGSAVGNEAAFFYLVAYFISMLGAFSVVTVLSEQEKDAEGLTDYQGLIQRRPLLAVFFTSMLLSLAGVPLTAGFIANFYLLKAGANAELWLLLVALVLSSVLGLYYYLRIVAALFSRPMETPAHPFPTHGISLFSRIAMVVLVAGLLWLGLFPNSLLMLIENMIN